MRQKHFTRTFKFVALSATAAIAAATIAIGVPAASAATKTVTVPAGEKLFAPQNLGNITVGDTITFKNDGTHNVVSAQIPAGATPFESPILSGSAATFDVTVTVPGNYRYVCTLHNSKADADAPTQNAGDMVGQFIVVAAGGTPTATTTPDAPAPTTAMPEMTDMPTTAPEETTAPEVTTAPEPTTAPDTTTPPAAATPRTVTIPAGEKLFAPQNLGTINVGDTITWKNDSTHNVVSAKIPAGATAFESPILSGSTATWSLKVTVPGNYRYVCSLHNSAADANLATQNAGHMVGQFTVVGAAIPAPAPGTDPAPAPGTDPAPAPGTDPAPAPGTDPVGAPAPAPVGGKAAVTISGDLSGFTPATVHITAGVATTITYKNPDSSEHDVTVEDLNFKVAAAGGASASKVLTPTAAQVGSHPFICSVGGHAAVMKGTLIIDKAGTVQAPVKAPVVKAPATVPDAAPAPAPAPVGGKAAVTVSGGFTGFTPKTFHVVAGVATTITYKNTDATPHDFTVSDMDFQIASGANASESKVLTPTAAQVGEHKFICSISGHDGAMNGTMIVDKAGTKIPTNPGAGAAGAGAGAAGAGGAQVTDIPVGGVQAGSGSTAGFSNAALMTTGFGLLMAAFMSAMLGRRVARTVRAKHRG